MRPNKWFRVNKSSDCIYPVDIDHQCGRYVILWDGKRKAVCDREGGYFKDFAEAKGYLVGLRRQDLDHAEWSVRNARGRLADVEALREPGE